MIAAHNYTSHFGRLSRVSAGDEVTFTDMEGIVNAYAVAAFEEVNPTLVEDIERSGHPLVLYTCTGGKTRSAVFCTQVSPCMNVKPRLLDEAASIYQKHAL